MRVWWSSLWIVALIVSISAAEEKLGGPGNTQEKPLLGLPDNTFGISVPTLATSLKQGETKVVEIDLRRGKNFDQDVTLSFGHLPKGVTVTPAQAPIKHGATGTKLTVQVADDAALGDFTVQVKGHPEKGTDALSDWKLTIRKK